MKYFLHPQAKEELEQTIAENLGSGARRSEDF
jgi:hypothetical protein